MEFIVSFALLNNFYYIVLSLFAQLGIFKGGGLIHKKWRAKNFRDEDVAWDNTFQI